MMKSQRGFTLLELMIALILVATLTVASYASYSQFAERARVAKAIGEIGQVHIAVQRYLLEINAGFPANLAEVGLGNLVDPWGNPYQFLVIDGLGNNGAARKDQNLVPVNRQYDIYSMGEDGVTASPFTSTLGKDDIVMAADGGYFGLAEDF